jgi:hypothetical protein
MNYQKQILTKILNLYDQKILDLYEVVYLVEKILDDNKNSKIDKILYDLAFCTNLKDTQTQALKDKNQLFGETKFKELFEQILAIL